ncbi:MAG: AbrB/MazE/SpoVT family DNA-binding domain-containing protein [Actinomycetota bacterium]
MISEKGQVTVPKGLRERFGLRPGTEVEFVEEEGRIVLRKAPTEDPVESVRGILRTGRTTEQVLAELRGDPDPLGDA